VRRQPWPGVLIGRAFLSCHSSLAGSLCSRRRKLPTPSFGDVEDDLEIPYGVIEIAEFVLKEEIELTGGAETVAMWYLGSCVRL
jgi:hypothetical protein